MTYREGTPFQRALKALRGNWQSALMIGFIVCMIQLLPQVLLLFDSQQTLESLSGDANYETLSQLLEQRLVPLALMLVAPLISSVFLQGLMVHLLKLFRGQPAEVKDAFCRLRNAPRIIGLEVLRMLLYMLRALPFVLGIVAISLLPDQMSAGWMLFLLMACFIGMIAAIVTALYRYAMADWLMAEEPGRGIRDCLRESGRLMKDRRFSLFRAEFLCLMLNYFAVAISSYGGVILMVASLMGQLAVLVLQQGVRAAFYLDLRPQKEQALPDAPQGEKDLY